MGPCVPAAHMINPSKVDASGYRMFQLKELIPALFGTRGAGGMRMGPSSSPPLGPSAPAGSVVRRTMRSALSTEIPAARSESMRERMRPARVTESAAVVESCLLANDLI